MIKQIDNKVFTTTTLMKLISFIPHFDDSDIMSLAEEVTSEECAENIINKIDQFSTTLIYHIQKGMKKSAKVKTELSIDQNLMNGIEDKAIWSKKEMSVFSNISLRTIHNLCKEEAPFRHSSKGIHVKSFFQYLKDYKPKYYQRILNK